MTSLLKCPFCGATPHQGPGKKSRCQLHGDESQGWKITCPHGCAGLEMPSRELAMEKWNTRCASPVTGQAQPVAVTTHGQLDLIRRDDSGKMFPLDGYLHRSVEAIPLFTSPSDQSALLAEAAEVLSWYADPLFPYAITQVAEPRSAVHADGGDRARAFLAKLEKR